MLTELKQIIATANHDYQVEYEEASMMNIMADEIKRDQPWAYIEELYRVVMERSSVKAKQLRCRFISAGLLNCRIQPNNGKQFGRR